MPLKIAVEVRDALGNINEVIKKYSVTSRRLLFDFFDFPRGLYQVPKEGLPYAKSLGFNIVLPDNYTSSYCEGTDRFGGLPRMLDPWLEEAKSPAIELKTLAGWFGQGEMACPACPWQRRIDRCLFDAEGNALIDVDKIDIMAVVDEPMPIRTDIEVPNGSASGCTYEESPAGQEPEFPCWPKESAPYGSVIGRDYVRWRREKPDIEEPEIDAWQVFFDSEGHYPGLDQRVHNLCHYLNQLRGPENPIPLHINMLIQKAETIDSWFTKATRRTCVWARFMPYCHIFSLDLYPEKVGLPLSRVATFMDEMHEARRLAWGESLTYTCEHQADQPWLDQWRQCRLPELWWVLDCSDDWGWIPDPEPGHWERCTLPGCGKCPTERQYKAMTYLAVTHGAKGILTFRFPDNMQGIWNPPGADLPPPVWYEDSPHCGPSDQWKGMAAVLKETNDELATLSKMMNSPDSGMVKIHEYDLGLPGEPLPGYPQIKKLDELISLLPPDKREELLAVLSPRSSQSSVKQPTHSATPEVLKAPGLGISRSLASVQQPAHKEGFDYAIHVFGGRMDTLHGIVSVAKYWGGDHYLITVNGMDSWQLVVFECLWVPGFHKEMPAMEVYPLLVEILFDHRFNFLLLDPPLFGANPYMIDFFRPYERRVYRVSGKHGPWPAAPPPVSGAPLVNRLSELVNWRSY